jgi:transposase-like protein
MASTRKRDGGRRHDPELIRELLAEHRTTGRSYAALAERAGIPVGTLAWWAHRERRAGSPAASPFVEICMREDAPTQPERPGSFAVDVEPGTQVRRITVPAGFDSRELQRLVAALEASSC